MIIGVPREIKPGEQRVALTPAGVRALVEATHRVIVERGAGAGSSIRDEEYTREGATAASVDEVWAQADMILKVKEPLAEEYPQLRAGQILFTYLHLAADPELTDALLAAGRHRDRLRDGAAPDGSLPLLAPMSEVAGRLAVQVGAFYLDTHGGRGSCSAACPACRPATSPCSAAASSASTRRASRSASAPTSRSSTSNLDRLRAARRHLPRPRDHADVEQPNIERSLRAPTCSSAPCWLPAPRRRRWSPRRWSPR